MFDRFAEGVLGLFLFFSHWLSPGADDEVVRIVSIRPLSDTYIVACAISLSWNEQMKDLIDAGVPVRFHFRTFTNIKDTISCIRTLQCDVADYTYSFRDSLRGPLGDTAIGSKQYQHLLIALEKFTQWETRVPRSTKLCRIEAEMLPSSATRLHRKIDMSQICGHRFFAVNFDLAVKR
jgi:hypothetical protein